MAAQTKTEIVCITRHGFNMLHTEGADFAAKVTQLTYIPGSVGTRDDVRQELLIPLIGVNW
jgi:hypothetical protein